MESNDLRANKSSGSRKTEAEAQITTADLRDAPTFVRASRMPRQTSADGAKRLEGAIKQVSIAARQTDDEWLALALAELVADLERLWALAEGFEYTDGESA